uniref:uncharacterized protein LOC112436004 n=1 Tax=Maylandia zebra TaxID=106582 RepID=UPI000D31F106|nr:uncharacterized protein LOC112436004 [Maylandia zebra]
METINENSIVVTPDQIIPPINRCFERLSEVQWSIIENGKCDSSVHAVLADMISEIIQIASASILRIALLVIQEPMIREEFMDEGKIRVSLGDSISAAIAGALNVSKQQDKSADKLTLMVEEEISEKVSSTIALIEKSPDFPVDPAVYVSGKFSSIKKLHRMVCCAASCLKRYAACKLRCQCGTNGSHSSTERTGSKISVKSAIAEISVILSTRSSDGEMTGKDKDELPEESQSHIKPTAETQSIQAPTPVEMVAVDIVGEILANMDSSSEELCEKCNLPKPAFNAGLIIHKVRHFFSKCVPSTSHARLKARKHNFSMFAKKQFEKMKTELKKRIKANRKHFVCLQNICNHPKKETAPSNESIVFILPGSVPETAAPQSTEAHRSPSPHTASLGTAIKRSSSVDFNVIRSDVNQLFDKLTKKEELFLIDKTLGDFKNSGHIRNFTEDLVANLFDLLTVDRGYQIPIPLMGRSLSDTVISRTPKSVQGSKRRISAEVLYVLIDDTVERFLQKLLLFCNEEKDQMIQMDKISGALEDIHNFIKRTQTTTQEKSPDSDGRGKESGASLPTPKPGSISPDKCSVASDKSPRTPQPGSISPDKSSGALSLKHSLKDSSKISEMDSVSGSSSDVEKISNDLALLLIMRVIYKSKPETQKFAARIATTTKEIDTVINRLSNLMQPELSSTASATSLTNDKTKFIKKIAKRLIKEFGSPDNVLKALMANDSSFDEALIRHLKITLGVIPGPPKTSKISRFFSAVGKTLLKPFRWFTKARDH